MRHNPLFSQVVTLYFKGFLFGSMMIGIVLLLFLKCMPFFMYSALKLEDVEHQKVFMRMIMQPISVSLSLGIDVQNTRGITGHFKEIINKYPHIQSISLLNNENVVMKRYVHPSYLEKGEENTYREPVFSPHQGDIIGFLEFSYITRQSVPLFKKEPLMMIGLFILCLWGLFLGQRLWREDAPLVVAMQYSVKLLKHGHFSTIFWTHKKNIYGFFVRYLNFFIIRAHETMKNLENHSRKKTFLRSCDQSSYGMASNTLSGPSQHIDDVMLNVVLEEYRIPLSLKRIFLDHAHISWHPLFHGMIMIEGGMSISYSVQDFSNYTFSWSSWSCLMLFGCVMPLLGVWIFWKLWQKWGHHFSKAPVESSPSLSLLGGSMNVGAYFFAISVCVIENNPIVLGCLTLLRWGVLTFMGRYVLNEFQKNLKGHQTFSFHKRIFCMSYVSFFMMGILLSMILNILDVSDTVIVFFFVILLISCIKIFFDHLSLDESKCVKNYAHTRHNTKG